MSNETKRKQQEKAERVVAEARRERERREQSYRARALKMYPWVCGRCGREFDRSNVSELTVHHRDHNHDNNPPDGSNWELLCVYCHDNEHSRYVDNRGRRSTASEREGSHGTYKPFADLDRLLDDRDDRD